MTIRIATRASKLALWQAHYVADRLNAGGHRTEIITMDTIGDKILDVTISKIGSKGVFTEELEEALKQGLADIAVHSAKDMQSTLPENFELIAFTEREQVPDVLVSHRDDIRPDEEIRIGTSSTRRIALLKHYYPKASTVPIRGNLQTRIKKMESGDCDALLLAYAGVHRMEYDHLIRHIFSLDEFTPAVGQGTIAVEAHGNLSQEIRDAVHQHVNDQSTSVCLGAERAFLKKLQGGCSIPVFGLAELMGGKLTMEGGIVSLDGQRILRETIEGAPEDAQKLGDTLAQQLLAAGGDRMLLDIKTKLQ